MEISLVKNNSIKIKSGKTVIATDPFSKVEAQGIILTDNSLYELDKVEGNRVVISGPGEYEVGGISIVCKNIKGENVYNIVSDTSNILFLPSTAVPKIQEDNEYDCVVIKVVDKIIEDAFSVFNAKCYILYGGLDLVNLKSENIVKGNKVNLRKTEEITGKIFLFAAGNGVT